MEKYPIPTLPTVAHVMEDIADKDIVHSDYPVKLSVDDENVQNAYTFFYNCKRLEEDLAKHVELKEKLEELKTNLQEKVISITKNKTK